eukprot:2827885-Rhodomonas_salina.3
MKGEEDCIIQFTVHKQCPMLLGQGGRRREESLVVLGKGLYSVNFFYISGGANEAQPDDCLFSNSSSSSTSSPASMALTPVQPG